MEHETGLQVSGTESAEFVYPAWLPNIFLIFTVEYKNQWTDCLQDSMVNEANNQLWYDQFKDYDPEVIEKSARTYIRDNDFIPTTKKFKEVVDMEKKILETKRVDLERIEARENNETLLLLEGPVDNRSPLEKAFDVTPGFREKMIEISKRCKNKSHLRWLHSPTANHVAQGGDNSTVAQKG